MFSSFFIFFLKKLFLLSRKYLSKGFVYFGLWFICLFLVNTQNLFGAQIFLNPTYFTGDLIKVSFSLPSSKKPLPTVVVNGKKKKYFLENKKSNTYFFFDGYDIAHPSTPYEVVLKTRTHTFKKKSFVRKKKLPKKKGYVALKTKKTKSISTNTQKMGEENRFFHPYFKRQNKTKKWQLPFIYPIKNPRISSPYGKPRYYNTGRTSFHRGTDFSGKIGDKVFASNDGKVVFSGQKTIRGNSIIINHGTFLSTSYWHLQDRFVKTGDFVKKGQPIGTLGNTGLSTGPHLHWEARIKGVCIDAIQLFSIKN